MQTNEKIKMSALEYEKLPEGPPQQLIDGEIIMSPSPSSSHQRLVVKLTSILEIFTSQHNLGYIYVAPMDVFLSGEEVYQPDILFISDKRKDIVKENIKGTPDLIIEVLSPSNAYYDLVHKKNVYEETGVKEFWVVDPEEKSIEIYENIKSTFIPFSKAKSSGVVNSKLLSGLSIEIEKLFSSI